MALIRTTPAANAQGLPALSRCGQAGAVAILSLLWRRHKHLAVVNGTIGGPQGTQTPRPSLPRTYGGESARPHHEFADGQGLLCAYTPPSGRSHTLALRSLLDVGLRREHFRDAGPKRGDSFRPPRGEFLHIDGHINVEPKDPLWRMTERCREGRRPAATNGRPRRKRFLLSGIRLRDRRLAARRFAILRGNRALLREAFSNLVLS